MEDFLLPFYSAASTSQEGYESNSGSTSSRKLRVTLLSSEWRSTKGGLSTINRELAIQLAKHPSVEVSVYLPRCSEADKQVAASHHVHLIEAEEMAGLEPDLWLSCLPEDHTVDCVIGHGAVLGRQVQIIKHHHHCKWIQVVHTAPEELGMYKSYTDAISRGEKKHRAEVKLCEKADQVVAVGPKLAEAFSGYLRSCGKDQDVLNLTPGVFSEFADVKQATEERKMFSVLAFGRGDNEDFQLKGYDIAAKAIAELKDDPQPYKLLFVGARGGEEETVKDLLLQQGIDHSQLSVRCFNESREQLAGLFCEADLAIMPSRTEGFGLAALEALSAGLPVLVSGNSGLGEALKKVPYGSSCVVESENPKDWAKAINAVRQKDRQVRLEESKILSESYSRKYNWQDHCNTLVGVMLNISRGNVASNEQNLSVAAAVDCQLNEEPSHSKKRLDKGENLDIRIDCDVSEQGAASSTQNVYREENAAPKIYPSTQEVMNLIAAETFKNIDPSKREDLNGFCQYLSNVRQVLIVGNKTGSLIITVQCNSLQILDRLWEDYCVGHLQEVAQRYLVTKDVLKELGVDELQLTVTINEEEYRACRKRLLRHEENQNPASATNKDEDNQKESSDTAAKDHLYSNPLLKSERETKQIVATSPPRGAYHRRERLRDDEGPKEIRGRGFRGRRGRGSRSRPGRSKGRGAAGSYHQPGAIQRQLRDPVSLGFTQPGIRYEWNKLYVLGLHYRMSPDRLKNFMELISGYEVKRVDWFKPNGKAIVTFNTAKLTGKDFSNILAEAKRRPQEGVNVLIERAPECKSVFVCGFSEDTTKEQVETYFDNEVGALDVARRVQINNQLWNEEKKHKRAIVYFKDKKSLWRATRNDHFLDGRPLHVEAFYPYMGTIVPVDEPKWPSWRLLSSEAESARLPEFYKSVDRDLIHFVMKSNQEVKLKEELDQCEHARIRWTNTDGYVLIKYGGTKVNRELDEQAWKRRCSEIVDSFLDNYCAKDFPLEEEIVNEVADQLPQIERLFPKLIAQVKLRKDSCQLRLMCQKSNMPVFEEKLTLRLKEIKPPFLEKKLEQKKRTDIASGKLQLLHNAKIEDLLKKEFITDVQAKVDLGGKSLLIKTPKGLMESVMSYLNKRLDEIDQNSIANPPEILSILKIKVGKRKMRDELPEGCAFNVDEKTHSVILLGRTLDETVGGREKAMEVLISDRNLFVNDKDNHLIGSEKWNDLCKKLEKRLTIHIKRELSCIAVFGFREDVAEAVTKMRDFLNEKKATEGEFRLGSPVHRRFFNEFYKDELSKIKEELAFYAVKVSLDKDGYRICFSGTEDGVKEVEERLYLMQEQIKEKVVNISTPGMRTFLAQEEGKRLIATIEREQKCVIEVTEQSRRQGEEDESDDDESLSTSSDGEDEADENEETITLGGKKVIWKTGNIEEEQADILVCSVGSNFNLSTGVVANAMSKAAGPALQINLREKTEETAILGERDIIHTVPGNLPCRYVIHCVCCPWKGGAEQEQILRRLLVKCFDRASELWACSIGLPLIGTGNLNFPYDIAVQIMIKSALYYSLTNPDSPLEEFRFIVYGGDQNGITAFEKKFQNFKVKTLREPRPSKSFADLSKSHPVEEVADAAYNDEGLESSADELPTCWVIVHGRTETFDTVIEAMKDGVAKACKEPRTIKHEAINRLSKRYIRDLKRMARARDVKLDQPEADTIRLEGLPKDVMDVNSEVSDAIQEQREREHREERAEQTSKTVQWYMVDVSGKLEPFEKMANSEIDSAYKSKKPSLLFTHENLKAEINFGTMEVTFLRNGRIKQVKRIDVYPIPDKWDPQPRDERGREETLHLVSLAHDSQEFKMVEEKFLQSLRGKVSITSIERVQNPSLFNAYALRKQTMDLKNGPHENQRELFHGTKYEFFKSINVQGFNRSLFGEYAAAYGDGVYFAKDASYSEAYSKPGPRGERRMYLAKVLVGKYTAGKQGMKRPPPIDPNKPEILYDSVVNNKDNPTIFVIFHDSQSYPEYIITFKRL